MDDKDATSANSRKTIVFLPIDAHGHVNAMLGLANALKQLGHRTVFICNDNTAPARFGHELVRPQGSGARHAQLSEAPPDSEQLMFLDENKHNTEKWAKMVDLLDLRLDKPDELVPSLSNNFSLLKMSLELEVLARDQQMEQTLRSLRPDLLLVDQLCPIPAVWRLAASDSIPWISVSTCNPLPLYRAHCDAFPPPLMGVSVAVRGLGLELAELRYERALKQSGLPATLLALAGAAGLTTLEQPTFEEACRAIELVARNESPWLNVYTFPRQLDYRPEGPAPDGRWLRVDALVRDSGNLRAGDRLLLDQVSAWRASQGKAADGQPNLVVYLSMGTTLSCNLDFMGAMMGQVLSCLRTRSSWRFLVALGPRAEQLPDRLRQQMDAWRRADRLLYASWWPQPALFARQLVDACVTHGGNNTICELFHFGRPRPALVVVAGFHDQLDNARRIGQLELGVTLTASQLLCPRGEAESQRRRRLVRPEAAGQSTNESRDLWLLRSALEHSISLLAPNPMGRNQNDNNIRDESPSEGNNKQTDNVPPQPPIIAPASAPAREAQEYHLNCATSGGNPEPNITWYKNDQPVSSQQMSQLLNLRLEQAKANETTTSTLSWIPTIDDHRAVFRCAVWNKAMGQMQSLERDFRLDVEYSPRISVGQFNPLKVLQGVSVTLPCQVDANPPVKSVRWLKDGQLIGNQYNYTINEVRTSDSAIYSCQADNGIKPPLGSIHQITSSPGASQSGGFFSLFNSNNQDDQLTRTAAEAQLQLQVLYPPRVQVRPSKSQPLNESDFFSLNCSVDAWPPAHEFIWTKLDDPMFRRSAPASGNGGTSYLEFGSISASDMGNYTCTAVNRMEPSPTGAGFGLSGGLFERQASASALVVVRHKPGQAEISLGQGGETELGTRTQIQCRVRPAGYPEPRYLFWKYGGAGRSQKMMISTPDPRSPIYTIHSATSDHEAKYGCSAYNDMGTSSETYGDLVVNEVPSIMNDASLRDQDVRSAGDHAYSITVRASGKPQPKVSWFHRSPIDGRRYELSWADMRDRFRIETVNSLDKNHGNSRTKSIVVSTLNFLHLLKVDDRGLYSVEFNNGLSRTAVHDLQLHINHAPIPAPKNQPIEAASLDQAGQLAQPTVMVKAGYELGETVNLTCRVSAYPKPTFVWHSNTEKPINPDHNPSRYSVMVENPRDDIWESTLTFGPLRESDYGDYACASANTDPVTSKLTDSAQIIVSLAHKTQPDPPTQLEALESTQDSITIQWLPGFDGGFAQNQYLVQWAPDDGSGNSLSRRYPDAVDPQLSGPTGNSFDSANGQLMSQQLPSSGGWPRLFDCINMNPCTLGQLSPRQGYVFRVRARNELGLSDYSEELHASTRANSSQMPRVSEASYDKTRQLLTFRLEPGTDYLLNSLMAKIELRNKHRAQPQQLDGSVAEGWRQPIPPITMRQERMDVELSMQPATEDLRITLCARSNETLCGPEFTSDGSILVASSFLQDQRGFSLSVIVFTCLMIIVLALLVTSVHSCCLSRRNKKADSLDRSNMDNKSNGGAVKLNGNGPQMIGDGSGPKNSQSHGSTTSTNSTSAAATVSQNLQSMESISGPGTGAGSASDHSSNHSRQAKLDSMLPPFYNHYADRASIMMEQQQHQQQQMMMQQQGLLTGDKLGSPFGLQNNALLSVASSNNNGSGYYGQQMEAGGQRLSMMDATNGFSITSGLPTDGQHQQPPPPIWPSNQMDEYNNYNGLNTADYVTTSQQQQVMESAYGTTGDPGNTYLSPDQSGAPSGQFQSAYLAAYQPDDQYLYHQQQQQQQQQQQLYGTLTRANYSAALGNPVSAANELSAQDNANNQLIMVQQQQLLDQQYGTTTGSSAGLMGPPAPPPQQQESDYGTTGSRSGRLIREIIV